MQHPYRHANPPERRHRARFDRELGAVYLVVWIGSVIRVVTALVRHERFGTELTLAVLAIFVLPVLTKS